MFSCINGLFRLKKCLLTATDTAIDMHRAEPHDGSRRTNNVSVGLLFRLLWVVVAAGPSGPAMADAVAVDREALDRAIHAAATYLHRSIDEDGRFIYRLDARTGEVIGARYNLLRHAGTVYALGMYHDEHPPNAEERGRIERSLRFMTSCCIRQVDEAEAAWAVWSPPALVGGRRSFAVAKLGGAALGGLALLRASSHAGLATDHERLLGLGRFLVFMQRHDGEFHSLYAPELGGRDGRWQSLYYPGEAVLALIALYSHDRDPQWLRAAIDGLRALARSRESGRGVPPDHWALIASAALFDLPAAELQAAAPYGVPTTQLKRLLHEHAGHIVRTMLAEARATKAGGRACARGGFSKDGRSTPTATRLEGLLAIRHHLSDAQLRAEVDAVVERAAAFILRAQLSSGPERGGFPRVVPQCDSGIGRDAEVRIDYVQHALSALLMFRQGLPVE